MYKIIIKTYNFVENFLKYDLNLKNKKDIKKIEEETFQIEFKEEELEQLKEFISHCLYYSRLIKNLYLEKEINEKTEFIDLLNLNLSNRDYKINKSNNLNNELNPILVNYCLYQLGLDEEEDYSIIDPLAQTGETIIETEIFASKKPLNLQQRTKIPAKEEFEFIPQLPKQNKTKNKILAFVQDNNSFKNLKENMNFANSKIKVSQYELDWLDVKFKEAEIDFAITQITPENEDKLDKLLYMLAFVISDAILLISHKEIDKKIIKKYELEIELEEKIEIENKEFFITILN